jgi:heptose I phosphotransferase
MPLAGYGKRGINPAKIQSFVITEELTNTASLEDFCRLLFNLPLVIVKFIV